MGIRSGISVFLRPPYYGGIQRTRRPGTREKEIGFEREREREIPSFQNGDAHALRFGRMNPISRIEAMPVWGKAQELESRFVSGQKL